MQEEGGPFFSFQKIWALRLCQRESVSKKSSRSRNAKIVHTPPPANSRIYAPAAATMFCDFLTFCQKLEIIFKNTIRPTENKLFVC